MTRPLRVIYSLPDGAQSSVLLRTALFDELTRADDVQWTFVSPLAGHPDFARSFQHPNARLHAWPALRLSFVDRQLQFFRQELWKRRVRNSTAEVFARRMPWVEPKRYRFHHRLACLCDGLPGMDRLIDNCESWFVGDGPWKALLDQVRPDAVVLGSGGTKLQEVPLGRAASRCGIPVFGIIPSWDNLTSKGPLVVRCRQLSVWCERMRQEAVELYGYELEDIVLTGPPMFDPHLGRLPGGSRLNDSSRARFFEELRLDPARRLITYTSVPPAICPFSARYAELLARLIESSRLGKQCQLFVRMHPQDDFSAFERLADLPHVRLDRPGRYRGEAQGNAAILRYDPSAADVRRLTDTLQYSDVIVNIASTITLEACALDRQVINLAFNLGPGFDIADYYRLTHYQPVTDSGAVRIVRAEAELDEAIAEALTQPHERSRLRRALYRQYDPFADGQAALRLAGAIMAFVKSERVASADARDASALPCGDISPVREELAYA